MEKPEPFSERLAPLGDELLTSDDVERLYRIKKGTQAAMRSRRQIPFIRLGGGRLIRYSRSSLNHWIATAGIGVGTK